MQKRKVTWTKQAFKQFNAAIKFIRKESDQNADKVKATLLDKINDLSDDRITHRADPYKKSNDGNYLYFELLHYRVVYYRTPQEVFIIRLRHTSMEPKKY
ncbi:type II toxin-antitoxin system RelE/ParE family toxin [Ferruginibacter sp.]|nr:type II toxin-antitoxin system RelE/ParE family toxin [Ferruginibacter sp.]